MKKVENILFNKNIKYIFLGIIALTITMAVGCVESPTEPDIQPTATPLPQATATAVPTSTQSPVATATAISTSGPTPMVTATFIATATTVSTPIVTPTP